jgi:hypothetical protein
MLLDTRYLYLGKTTADRNLVKIGIAKDVDTRWQQIDRSVSGSEERCILCFPVANAAWLETQLHRKYAHRRKTFKGSGKTEWFDLPLLARIWLVLTVAAHGLLFGLACLLLLLISAVALFSVV